MPEIYLKQINIAQNRVSYNFSFTSDFSEFFSGEEFFIEYPESIENVPKGILAIPFVCNILPIIWLTNATLYLPIIDKDFFESIPEFKKGYINMYPDAKFQGDIVADKIEENIPKNAKKSAAFFSGGLDATTTLLRHINENPYLISIWGSDIKVKNKDGWDIVKKGLSQTALEYGLSLNVIRSSFREFDNDLALTKKFSPVLHDSWWHGVKHGIGLISHAAPFVWENNISMLYIASSFSPEAGKVTCASDPTIDNFVRFCGCNIYHDAYELNRMAKTEYISKYCETTDKKITLHVCWESQSGHNCSKCEKCYRTMLGFIACGDNPENYGFKVTSSTFSDMRQLFALQRSFSKNWKSIKNALIKNWYSISKKDFAKDIKWILKFDFEHPETNVIRKRYLKKKKVMELKENISYKFPKIYKIYCKIVNKQP